MDNIPQWVVEELKEQNLPLPIAESIQFTKSEWEHFNDNERIAVYQLSQLARAEIEIVDDMSKLRPIKISSLVNSLKRPVDMIDVADDEYRIKKMKEELYYDLSKDAMCH
jgi:hypothetical protein